MAETRSVYERAAARVAAAQKWKNLRIVDRAEARDAAGKTLFRVAVVDAAHPNGRAYSAIVDAEAHPVTSTPAVERLFDRTVLSTPGVSASPLAPVVITPDSNVLTLNPGDVLDETITVTIPKSAGTPKADVYFLADTTGSMTSILSAVQAGASSVLGALAALGVDLAFGVGNYKDFTPDSAFGFQHQVNPTSVAATVTAAINTWSAVGGEDTPEAALFALDRLAESPGGAIGWRAGSKRIIVWFGDAPSHDSICAPVSGSPTVTEATATTKLTAQGITVLAISTANPGLDDDPTLDATSYGAQCGPPGGLPGQATRIANATGGVFATGINAGNIVNTIVGLVTGAIAGIQNVKLVPSASVAPFIVSITPAAGYGPLAGDKDHVLTFDVKFAGIPCKPEPQVITGSIDVVADGHVVARKKVQITVPPCKVVYSVKFICGVQPECGCECSPVQPGKYATEISIHNYSVKNVEIIKRFVPVVLASAPVGREPRVARVRAEDKIVLPSQTATMDDCCRIAELVFGGAAPSPMPLTIGVLEITATAEVAVTAIYTTSDAASNGIAISVESITGRRL